MLETFALRDDSSFGAFSWRMSEDVAKCLQNAQVNLRKSAERIGLPKEDWDKPFEQLVRAIEENIRGSLSIISASITAGPLVVGCLSRMEETMKALALDMLHHMTTGGVNLDVPKRRLPSSGAIGVLFCSILLCYTISKS